jgi:uncharacterized protein (DUF1499 family)
MQMLATLALTASVIISPGADSIKMSPTPSRPMCLMNVDAKTIINAKDVTTAKFSGNEVRYFLKDVAEPVVVELKEGQDGLAVISTFLDRVAESCQ